MDDVVLDCLEDQILLLILAYNLYQPLYRVCSYLIAAYIDKIFLKVLQNPESLLARGALDQLLAEVVCIAIFE